MKALIPVAGAGTQLRPHTYTQPKPLIPVAGKPIISHIIDQLTEAGINDFAFVIGYLGEKIKNFIDDKYPGLQKQYIQQAERKGLGHAIWMARDEMKHNNDLIIVLGDTIFEHNLPQFLAEKHSSLGVKKVTNPVNFGVAEVDSDYMVRRVIEKPRIPKSNLALVGLYKIKETEALFEALDKLINLEQKSHGEFQLTDALQLMIEKGIKFKAYPVDNWFDCGKKEILLETNATLLKQRMNKEKLTATLEGNIIIPPVSIGQHCNIRHSIIGPYVSIGDHADIKEAIITDSIIGNFVHIKDVILKRSVVGSDSSVTGMMQSFNLGDNTEIDFS